MSSRFSHNCHDGEFRVNTFGAKNGFHFIMKLEARKKKVEDDRKAIDEIYNDSSNLRKSF